ncbi:LOW QUALITY PROTEIN: connector enhancer of kinase suppressor of ras 1 [Amazona ochrocephala]
MEPVGTWGPAQAAAWLRGLDGAVQGYPFETWGLAGPDLLGLSAASLEALGVRRLGHQELLLEAVEQLRALEAGLASTSLRTLTERLQELAQGTQSLVLGELPAGAAPRPPSLALLARVVDLLRAAKGLFSWLNRYLFSTLNDFSASQDIVPLCAQLAEALQAVGARGAPALLSPKALPAGGGAKGGCGVRGGFPVGPPQLGWEGAKRSCPAQPRVLAPQDCPAAKRDSRILQICQHIVGICESIVGCSPLALLDRRAVLQRVVLHGSPPTSPDTLTLPPSPCGSPPTSPDTLTPPSEPLGSTPRLLTAPLGLKITSTTSCLHFVSATTSEALAAHRGLILPGDEIVQVNEQTVVGWTRVNLAKKLLENVSRVTLVLKKIPLDLPGSPSSPRQQLLEAFLDAADSTSTRSSECPGSPVSLTSSAAAADFDSGPDSALDPVTDEEAGEDKRNSRLRKVAVGELPALPSYGAAEEVAQESGSPPGTFAAELGPMAAPAEDAGGADLSRLPPEGSPLRGRRPKGVATRLSRRRVSCRDLGRVDCDGWLLKKKDHVGFMAQKWKRCWFVLKGHTLYWYHHPNDEKAAGLVNVATYDLESTREQKKKYVFQLCHQRYKPFIFAAETLADLSMWVSHLITAKTKYTLAHHVVPDREEDCYSETEAEDPDDESPRPGCDLVSCPWGHPGEGWRILVSPRLSLSQGKGCQMPQRKPSSSQLAVSPAAPSPAHPWVSAWGDICHLVCTLSKLGPPFWCVCNLSWDASECEPCSVLGLGAGAALGDFGAAFLLHCPFPHPEPSGEDLECLMRCLQQGGVSLIGRQQVLTQEQCRKSFIRRSKNPLINAKVHAVRALQSTLKAKLAELRALEQLLSDAALTSERFSRWKEEHQELYQELREAWAGRQGQDHDRGLGAERGLPQEGAEP